MIYWKAKFGYGNQRSINSLSDITFTDEGLVSIPVSSNAEYEQFNINKPDIAAFYDFARSKINNDVDVLYGQFYSREAYNQSIKTNVMYNYFQSIPSIIKNVPNLYSYISDSVPYYSVAYIPSLSIIFAVGNFGSSGYTNRLYTVGENGGAILLSTSVIFIPRLGGNVDATQSTWWVVPVLNNYNSPLDLININNYSFISMYLSVNSENGTFIYAKNPFYYSNSDLQAVYGTNPTKPDGSYTEPTNPYLPGEASGEGELPPGTFDDTSDPIPIPSIPTLSASDTGFTRIYNPTLSQVQELAQYLWTEPSLLETLWNHIKQFFEDPMDAMIGFNLVPVPVPDGGTAEFKVMYIGTGVMMTAAASQFVDVDCGSVQLDRYYGSALDQSPYTKVQCFLPYIGMVQLNTDEVMGTTLSVKYRVDIVSGSCVAYILVDGNALYQYSGHCAITIPFSSADFSSYVNAAIQVAKMAAIGAGSAVANMATDAVQEPGQATNQLTRTVTETTTERNAATGRQITTGTKTWSETRDVPQTATRASFSGLTPQNVANTVAQVMSSKPAIQHSGSFSGNSGYLGVRRPYLVIERPNMCLPANYQALNGYPAMITMTLGDCHGFTRVQQVQLTGVWATEPEQAEILQLLKTGVIL